jgi:hypothetical protein
MPEQSAVQSPFMRRAKAVSFSSDDDIDEDEEIQGDGSHFWEDAVESVQATSTVTATHSNLTEESNDEIPFDEESEAQRMREREAQIREILESERIADSAPRKSEDHTGWPEEHETAQEETFVTCEICSEDIAESALESHSIECLACSQVSIPILFVDYQGKR